MKKATATATASEREEEEEEKQQTKKLWITFAHGTSYAPVWGLTQHANDAGLCTYPTINIIRTPWHRLQQPAPLQLNPDEHVEHTDGRHGSAKEQKTGYGKHMCDKVVIYLFAKDETKKKK